MKHTAAFLISLLLVPNCFAQAVAPAAADTPERERLLISVRHADAATLTEKIGAIFNDASVTAASFPKAILVSAPPKVLTEVAQMVEKLDSPPLPISIDVWIVDVQPDATRDEKTGASNSATLFTAGSREKVLGQLARYEKEGRVVVANHIQLTTLDGQAASAQQGERKPRVTATNVTTTGRISTATFDNIGTLVKVQPRITSNNELVVSLNVQKSHVGSEAKGLPIFQPTNGPEVRSPSYLSLTAESNVNLKSGEVASLAAVQGKPNDDAGSYQVLVSAEVLSDKEAK